MRGLWSLAAASVLSQTTALQLAPRSDSPQAVSLPVQRSQVDPVTAVTRDRQRLRKRQDNTLDVELDNTLSLYFANLTLGTPAQDLRLHLDTGSSDLWVNLASSNLCRQGNCQGGTYDSDASSTHRSVNSDFNISYVDGSSASGDYVSDTLGFGGITIDGFQFGTGEVSTSPQGVLGIGFAINEVQVNRANGQPYPNLPAALKEAGQTASNVYSLWLNDLDASSGEILFGGVDTAKYSGDLQTVPMISQSGQYFQLLVALTGLSISGEASTSSELPLAVLLDSGSTLTYLPTDMAEALFNEVNAVWVDNVGAAYAPCNLADSGRTLEFNFSGAVITVPFNELFIEAGTVNGQELQLESGERACIFGISEVGDHLAVLGDTFLRSAYVVYDLENNEVSLANTVFNATDSNIRAITTASGTVPGATPVAHPVSEVTVGADGARLGGPSGSGNAAPGLVVSWGLASVAAFLTLIVSP